ncbi:histidinol and sodium permease [Scheffersomyces xylosifermentans]|uniref:histidinol and sodium permease n=1 Tax=Scheffersomyces xylosifermentans TaxID=1304137 RepID=UPI00315C83D3
MSSLEDTTKYYDDNYIPGTTNILVGNDSSSIETSTSARPLKRTKDGLILMPQPSDSPNDPLNWSFTRKLWHFVLLSFITALTAATSNSAGAAQDSLNAIYGISYDAMNTGAGVLFIFIGWSCIFFAPASSLYGRRITYIVCLLAGTLGSVWFASSRRTADTIWSQAFVGMSEACAEAQVQQSLSDIFFQHQLGSVLTVYILATSVGSFLGPLIAHLISQAQSFRWVGWWGAIICGITLVVVLFACEETVFDRRNYSAVFESSKSVEEPIETSGTVDEKLIEEKYLDEEKSESNAKQIDFGSPEGIQQEAVDVEDGKEKLTPFHKRIALITPSPYLEGYGFLQYLKRFIVYFKVFTLPAVWLSGLLWGLQDAYMTFFLTTQDTYFYDEPWNKSETGVAIMNVATLIGAVIGCFTSGMLSDKHVLWIAKKNGGLFEPEYRLWLLFVTLIISPAGLIMFGVGAARDWPWQVIYIGLGFIGFGWGSIGDTAMSYLMDAYPAIVIQGMVGVSIINNTLACIFTFVCSYWLDGAGTANTYIALAVIDFVSIAFIVPTLYFGKTWRKATKKTYLEMVELTQGMG